MPIQSGKQKAQYGKKILKNLSEHLTRRFGKGFSEAKLRQIRKFYEVFLIQQTVSDELKKLEEWIEAFEIMAKLQRCVAVLCF